MVTNKDQFYYLNNIRAFIEKEGYTNTPLSPWLASLNARDLNFLVDTLTACLRVENGSFKKEHVPDLFAVVIEIILLEKQPSEPIYISDDQFHLYVFGFASCGAFEQMRRVGVAEILSPMVLTSEYSPVVKIIKENWDGTVVDESVQ